MTVPLAQTVVLKKLDEHSGTIGKVLRQKLDQVAVRCAPSAE